MEQKSDQKAPSTNVKTLVLKKVNMTGDKKKEEEKYTPPKSENKIEKDVVKANTTTPIKEEADTCKPTMEKK